MREENEHTVILEEGDNNKIVKTFVGCEERRQIKCGTMLKH